MLLQPVFVAQEDRDGRCHRAGGRRRGVRIEVAMVVDFAMARYRPELQKYFYDPTKYKTYLDQLGITYPTLR